MSALGRLLTLPSMARQIVRLRQVAAVVIRYGFGHLITRSGLDRLLRVGGILGRNVPQADADLAARSWEVRVRLALEELGPTFVKLGQMLATRADLVPLSLIEELRRLQDNVPPFAAAEARALVERELGANVASLFARFDAEPIAAASIAQVHRAQLLSGEEVVLKLQRPGLDDRLRTDMELLGFLANFLEENMAEVRPFKPVAAVEEFGRSLRMETDFGNELRNIERFRKQMSDEPRVHIPATWPALSTRRVLTMEFLDGVKVTDVAAPRAWEIDPVAVAEIGTAVVISSIFEHGFFHGDPHPGNFFVMRDGRLGVIDFGMMGSLDRERIGELLSFMAAILLGDAEMLIVLLMDLGILGDDVDVRRLRAEISNLMARYHDVDLASVDIGTFMTATIEVVLRHDIDLPADLLLVGKAISTMEGVAREIHPGFNPMVDLRPIFVRLYLRRALDPETYSRRILRIMRDWWSLAAVVPGEVRSVLRRLKRGELRIEVADPQLEDALIRRDRQVNRAILAATTLVAWALFALLLPQAEQRGLMSVTTWWTVLLAGVGMWTGGLLGLSMLRSRAF
jgi:ubiquinone biosynthesis protein